MKETPVRVVDVNEYYSPTGGGVRTYLDRKMEIMAELYSHFCGKDQA